MIAPNIVVPIVLEILTKPAQHSQYHINSIVDFGCGLGTWLRAFKNNGVEEVLGLDGKWVNTDLLFKNIGKQEFRYVDLEKPIKLDKVYDLVMSLEVAEHLSAGSADTFVQSLVNAGKIILFSAAVPGQGGFNHINEQWPSYWIEKFQQHDYVFHDVIRNKIWGCSNVDAPYKQNIFIVAHKSIEVEKEDGNKIYDIVHPDFLFRYSQYVDDGEIGVKLFLSISWKFLKFTFKRKILRSPQKCRNEKYQSAKSNANTFNF
jgi:SAM-dependent methyltransferase